jgi:hypothetical protein
MDASTAAAGTCSAAATSTAASTAAMAATAATAATTAAAMSATTAAAATPTAAAAARQFQVLGERVCSAVFLVKRKKRRQAGVEDFLLTEKEFMRL